MKPQSFAQGIFTWMLIIGALFFFIFIFHRIVSHSWKVTRLIAVFQTIATKEINVENDKKAIKEKEMEINNLGLPPNYIIHPIDYYFWHNAFNNMTNDLDSLKTNYEKDENLLHSDTWYQIKFFFQTIWSELIHPVLEILLLLTTFSFGLRIFWRYLLMRGKLGTTRV
jgi:hypothetical protein